MSGNRITNKHHVKPKKTLAQIIQAEIGATYEDGLIAGRTIVPVAITPNQSARVIFMFKPGVNPKDPEQTHDVVVAMHAALRLKKLARLKIFPRRRLDQDADLPHMEGSVSPKGDAIITMYLDLVLSDPQGYLGALAK